MNAGEQSKRPLYVLLAEDSAVQTQLVELIVEEIPEFELVGTVADGAQALAFLRNEGEYADAQRPDLVILDINMPNVDGFEVLRELKSDPVLSKLPVVMLTASDADEDVAKSYEYGASTHIQKPLDPEKFSEIFQHFASYWNQVKLPPR